MPIRPHVTSSRSPSLSSKSIGRSEIKSHVVLQFTKQLATMLDAGLTLIRSLEVLKIQASRLQMRVLIEDLMKSVERGERFSAALERCPRVFGAHYRGMVRAGESGGSLGEVLSRLGASMERESELRKKVTSSLIYPLIVLVMTFGILAFLMVFIVPRFESMFRDMGESLPLLSQVVFGASHFLLSSPILGIPNVGWIGVGGCLVLFGGALARRSKWGRAIQDRCQLWVPILGEIHRQVAMSRFSRTLGTLLSSGNSILDSLRIAQGTVGNVHIVAAVQAVSVGVNDGATLAAMMRRHAIFPELLVSMVEVGEETGRVPEMLLEVSSMYDTEVSFRLESITALIEPLMVVGLSVLVGGIIFAMFLPMVEMIQTLQ